MEYLRRKSEPATEVLLTQIGINGHHQSNEVGVPVDGNLITCIAVDIIGI
jgi:hypothetical protein